MYRLQDDIGESNVNTAIREFLKTFAFKDGPYPISLQLEGDFQQFTPPQYQYLFEDLFRTITLYDVRGLSADYVPQSDGKYQVHLTVEAKKTRADGRGQEHSIPIDDWIDIGVLDANQKFLYLQKQRIDQEKTDFTVTVDKLPAEAGIDPLDKLITRNPDDHVIAVKRR
jgi:ABC-2 type transport system permease protein